MDLLGKVASIEYVRRGEPDVVYHHRFKRKPTAKYDPVRKELVIRPVDAEPV